MNHAKNSLGRRTPVRAGAFALGAVIAIAAVVALANWHAPAAASKDPTLLARAQASTDVMRAKADPDEAVRATVPSAADVIDRAAEPGEPSPSF